MSSAWSARSARATAPRGSACTRLCPSFAYTNIIKGSEQTLLDMGFPILDVADVVAAFARILAADSTGQAWYVVAGRESEPFRFRRAPGPRTRLNRTSLTYFLRSTGDGSRRGVQPRTASPRLMAPDDSDRSLPWINRSSRDPVTALVRTAATPTSPVNRRWACRFRTGDDLRRRRRSGRCSGYLLEVHHPVGTGGFPWPTLLINLSGFLAIGLLLPVTEHFAQRHSRCCDRSSVVRLSRRAGPPYSTLAVEATLLTKSGDTGVALAYLAATFVGGLALVVVGEAAGKRLVRREPLPRPRAAAPRRRGRRRRCRPPRRC